MSGKITSLILITTCLAFVGTALWLRSRDTSRVRDFWTPSGAALIQNASTVMLSRDYNASASATHWEDISQAPGLIHVRATLVDDRYYDWTSLRDSTQSDSIHFDSGQSHPVNQSQTNPVTIPDVASQPNTISLRFSEDSENVDILLDLDRGVVTNKNLHHQVHLIDASRQALDAFFKRIQ